MIHFKIIQFIQEDQVINDLCSNAYTIELLQYFKLEAKFFLVEECMHKIRKKN